MVRFVLCLLAVLALGMVPSVSEAGIFGRIGYRVTHPFAAVGSYQGGNGAACGMSGAGKGDPEASGGRRGRFRVFGGACAGGACGGF